MSANRLERVNELLKREIAAALFRVMNDVEFDPARVTVTHVVTASDLRKARVFLSILGPEPDQRRILRDIRKHRKILQATIGRHVILKYTPHLDFSLDQSLRDGDRVLQLIAEIEETGPGAADPDDGEWEDDDLDRREEE
jgi:ribosome-binding factor A